MMWRLLPSREGALSKRRPVLEAFLQDLKVVPRNCVEILKRWIVPEFVFRDRLHLETVRQPACRIFSKARLNNRCHHALHRYDLRN